MPKLKEITISAEKIKNLDISKLENLTSLTIWEGYECNIKFPDLDNIDNIHIEAGKVSLDLTNKKSGFVSVETYDGWENIKFPENEIVEYGPTVDGINRNEKICSIGEEKEIYISTEYEYNIGLQNILTKSNEFVEIKKYDNEYHEGMFGLTGKKAGKTEIEIIDTEGRKHKLKVVIEEEPKIEQNKEIDKTLDESGITAEFCGEYANKVLKSNGELWEIDAWEATGKILDTNVKKYISNEVYCNEYIDNYVTFENILYKDNTLKICSYEDDSYHSIGNEDVSAKEIKDVIDICSNLYLKSNGDLYAIRYSYVTEEFLEDEFITNGVEKIVGNFVVKDDNTLWFDKNESERDIADYKKEYKKVGKHEIKSQISHYWKEEIVTDYWGSYTDYVFCEGFVDVNNSLWIYYKNEWIKEKENYNENEEDEYYKYKSYLKFEDGKVYKYEYKITENGRYEYVEGELVLDNVVSVMYGDIIIRTDGSIWTYTEEKGLNKITKSTPEVEPEEKPEEKEEYIISENIKEKEFGEKTIISGLKVGQKIEEFLKENNFKSQYVIKVFDSENKEVASTEIIGTGTKVKLYENGNVVQEYTVIIYGDTTGDGKIEALDALNLIRAVNERITLKSEVYLEAGKVSGGEKATALDALTIVKSLNGKAEISQSM